MIDYRAEEFRITVSKGWISFKTSSTFHVSYVISCIVPADGKKDTEDKENEMELPPVLPFETKAYYNKSKSFFDNLTAAGFR